MLRRRGRAGGEKRPKSGSASDASTEIAADSDDPRDSSTPDWWFITGAVLLLVFVAAVVAARAWDWQICETKSTLTFKATAAPNTQPPNTQPPNTQPPNTQPPNTQPPNTQPSAQAGELERDEGHESSCHAVGATDPFPGLVGLVGLVLIAPTFVKRLPKDTRIEVPGLAIQTGADALKRQVAADDRRHEEDLARTWRRAPARRPGHGRDS